MTTVAFLGLGAMGIRMVPHLINAKLTVVVWNRTASVAAPLAEAGARVAQTPRDAADGADVVISVVRDDQASTEIWLDPENGALAGLRDGSLAIECSTVTPGHVKTLNEALSAREIALVDAPIAGSRPQAEAGQLVFFIGGTDEGMTRATPILETIGSKAVRVGPSGSAAALKLANNALLGIQVIAMAELIPFLEKAGLNSAQCIEIMEASPMLSPFAAMASKGMIAGGVPPMFPIELLRKDGGYVDQMAAGLGQNVPLTARMNEVLDSAIDAGLGDANFTDLIKLHRKD